MNCPQCGAPFVSHSYTCSTLVGFIITDEGHEHDDNCLKRIYVCAYGHSTELSLRRTCPNCDWKGCKTCSCHKGEKIDKWPELNPAGGERFP